VVSCVHTRKYFVPPKYTDAKHFNCVNYSLPERYCFPRPCSQNERLTRWRLETLYNMRSRSEIVFYAFVKMHTVTVQRWRIFCDVVKTFHGRP